MMMMIPTEPAYVYRARVHRVIDGDTYELMIDLGFDAWHIIPVRLCGVDCPERNTPEGQAARDYVEHVFAARGNGEILIRTQKTARGTDVRSFARYVADIWIAGMHVADILRAAGHVKAVAERAEQPPAPAERERIAREAAEACWTATVDRNDKRGLRVAYAEIIRAALDAAAQGGEQ